MRKILEVKNLSVVTTDSKKKILDNISFDTNAKSIFALIGPNGSGKTTLAYALMGLPEYKITSGKIILDGEDITKLSTSKRAKKGLTLAFQDPAYFDNISVENFLKLGNDNKRVGELADILSSMGLDSAKFLSRTVDRKLSGGERRRIELASIISIKPKLMILDEPDSGLDIIIYRELYDILNNIRQKTEASILLITHREEIGALSDKAAFLNKGKLVYKGSFDKVMLEYCRAMKRHGKCRRFQGMGENKVDELLAFKRGVRPCLKKRLF